MGNTSIRKLKKENKKIAIKGIENLISLMLILESSYDLSNLNRILVLCKSLKPGIWGKRLTNSMGYSYINWELSNYFKEFRNIYEHSEDRVNWIKTSKYYDNKDRVTALKECIVRTIDGIDNNIEKIDEKYKGEFRNSAIDSLLKN